MIKKIKELLQENRLMHKKTRLLLQEQEWAHVYHDSIRGIEHIEKLPLNIGRWAGGYAFFYVLHRILKDYKPKSILEFGLGESSKFVSTYIEHYSPDTAYQIIEENEKWLESFDSQFQLYANANVAICPLVLKEVHGFQSHHYKNFGNVVSKTYNLYIIDGPFGSARYSRYDLVEAISYLTKTDDFIILFDDCNRAGEQDTLSAVLNYFNDQEIKFHYASYQAQKTLAVIGSSKYSSIKSL